MSESITSMEEYIRKTFCGSRLVTLEVTFRNIESHVKPASNTTQDKTPATSTAKPTDFQIRHIKGVIMNHTQAVTK